MKKIISILFSLFLIFTCSVNVNAIDLETHRIPSGKKLHFIPYKGFGSTTISHFNEALYQWNKEVSPRVLMTRDPTERHSSVMFPTYVANGQSWIFKVEEPGLSHVARTIVYPGRGESIVTEADIDLNIYKAGFANSAQPGCFDVWSVFLHEAGHAAGLGEDYYDSTVVMYKYWDDRKNTTQFRKLTTKDKTAIQLIY